MWQNLQSHSGIRRQMGPILVLVAVLWKGVRASLGCVPFQSVIASNAGLQPMRHVCQPVAGHPCASEVHLFSMAVPLDKNGICPVCVLRALVLIVQHR